MGKTPDACIGNSDAATATTRRSGRPDCLTTSMERALLGASGRRCICEDNAKLSFCAATKQLACVSHTCNNAAKAPLTWYLRTQRAFGVYSAAVDAYPWRQILELVRIDVVHTSVVLPAVLCFCLFVA